MPGKTLGIKIECDETGLTESVWTNKKCKGDSIDLNFKWDECTKAMKFNKDDPDTWVKFSSTQKWGEDTMNMKVYDKAMKKWKDEFCLITFDKKNYSGKVKRFCLDPFNELNYADVPSLPYMNDIISSIKIGKNIKVVMYEHNLSNGFRDLYHAGYNGWTLHPNVYSSMRIYAADKAACLHVNY